jgi:hypothetical protein
VLYCNSCVCVDLRRLLKDDHADVIVSMNNIAELLDAQGMLTPVSTQFLHHNLTDHVFMGRKSR